METEGRKQRLISETRGDVTIVSFLDKKILDEVHIQEIGEELFSMVEEKYKVKMLLNFENVEYLSSAALGKLITLNKRIKTENGQLKLCNIKENIYEVFRITKLNKIFEIYDSEEAAVSKFKK